MTYIFKEGFPSKFSRKMLEQEIASIQKSLEGNFAKQHLAGHTTALDIALSELARRNQNRLFWITLGISLASILISARAIWFAHQDYRGDQGWQSEQLELLRQLELNTRPNNSVTPLEWTHYL